MKISKKRVAVSILTVFMMVFTVIPYMGKADVHAAAAGSFITTTPEITDANGNAAYAYRFEADETNYLNLKVSRKYFSGSDSGGYFTVQILDSANKVIASQEASGNIVNFEGVTFPAVGTYDIILYSGQNKMGYTTYQVEFNLGIKAVYDYKYESLTAKVYNLNEGSQYEFADYYVELFPGTYNGNDALDSIVYRENLSTGKFAVPYLSFYYDDEVALGANYKYYIVNRNHIDDYVTKEIPVASNANGSSKEYTLSANAKAELKEMAAAVTVSIPGPKVKSVSNLKNAKKGVKSATLTWWYPNEEPGYATGYEIKVYNSKGKVVATKYATDGRVGTKVYVPYAGTSKVKVTAYYNYNGKAYYGKSQTISVTSAKAKAASGNVTKLSNGKARIYAIKADGAASTQVQYKLPGKNWTNAKWVTQGATAAKYKKTVSVANAGKATYRFRSVVKDNGKTYYSDWKVYKPLKNERVYSTNSLAYWRNYDSGQPGPFKTYYQPSKVYYSGNSIKVTGKFFNTSSVNTRTCKISITFKDDTGKKIATKTVSCKVSPYTTKTKTFTLATKKNVNLRNITYNFTYKAQ